MQITVQICKGIGLGKDKSVFELKMRILAKDSNTVHDCFMTCPDIVGGRHWEYNIREGFVVLRCDTNGNHATMMRLVNHLLIFDKDSIF